MTARPVATAALRTTDSRSSAAGSPASASIQVMLSSASAPTAASASPAWMASASVSIPPPKRWTVPSTTMPSPTATSADGAGPSTGRAGRLLDGGARRRAHARALRGRADDVAEHRAGLDRGELARVADEDQPRLAPDRLGEPGHQRERDHRGLVDDHDVVGEAVAAVVAEAAVGAGLPAEQAVERRGLELEQPRADRVVDVEVAPPPCGPPRRAGRRPCRSGRRGRSAAAPRPRRAPAPRAARRCGRRSSSCRCPGRRPRPRAGAARPRRPPASAWRRAARPRTAG